MAKKQLKKNKPVLKRGWAGKCIVRWFRCIKCGKLMIIPEHPDFKEVLKTFIEEAKGRQLKKK